MADVDYPVAEVIDDADGQWTVLCPYCPPRRGKPEVHYHSQSEGHRTSHCDEDNPGYIVRDLR